MACMIVATRTITYGTVAVKDAMITVLDQGRLLGADSVEAVVVAANDVLGAGDAGREP